jgi:hypothetical protein
MNANANLSKFLNSRNSLVDIAIGYRLEGDIRVRFLGWQVFLSSPQRSDRLCPSSLCAFQRVREITLQGLRGHDAKLIAHLDLVPILRMH